MKENEINIIMPDKNNLKCTKCRYGKIINPFRTNCTKFMRKPYNVYFEGADCPEFVLYEKPGVKK